ncbi:MAG: sulfatase [Alphaproteobacteria bacterium]|nr:sulfatase [Alphaproteobacteria bacterium]
MWSLLLASCLSLPPQEGSRPAGPAPDPSARHVILISLDTLRADHLGAYGHPLARTPNLDKLAAEGVLFEQALSVAPTTLPSHTALMTGTYPQTHGAARNRYIVPGENRMLAETLGAQGFETGAAIGALPLRARFGFAQGFGWWDEDFGNNVARDLDERGAERVTDAALGWLATVDAPEHVFLFLHYYDVHAPYDPPAPYDALFPRPDPDAEGGWADISAGRAAHADGQDVSELSASLDALYLGELAFLDAQLGRLFEGLQGAGIWDDALIIVTADHGESMGEHWEYFGHGETVYEEVLRIPLIVRQPGGRGGGERVAGLVANIDVYPTVLERLGLPAEPQVEGLSFAAALDGADPGPRGQVFLEANKPEGGWTEEASPVWPNRLKCRAVRGERYKRVQCAYREEAELYDLIDDPGERDDLDGWPTAWGLAKELDGRIEAWDAGSTPHKAAVEGSAETTRKLEALGYIEGGG